MKAYILIKTKEGTKQIIRERENREDLIDWLIKMCDNPKFILGYLGNNALQKEIPNKEIVIAP